tara:strand:- start:309 stop:548 length:240 start_codon:yes stop_codon:yes gene_type:complete
MADNTPMIEQSVGDVSGNFTKSITVVDSGNTTGATHSGDVAATIEFIEKIYNYIPELAFATVYGLVMYALVRWITVKIK